MSLDPRCAFRFLKSLKRATALTFLFSNQRFCSRTDMISQVNSLDRTALSTWAGQPSVYKVLHEHDEQRRRFIRGNQALHQHGAQRRQFFRLRPGSQVLHQHGAQRRQFFRLRPGNAVLHEHDEQRRRFFLLGPGSQVLHRHGAQRRRLRIVF